MRGLPQDGEPALDTIRRTAAAGFRTAVSSSLDAVTREGALRTFEVLRDAGVHTWHVNTPMPVGCWTESTTALPLAESVEVCEALLRQWLDGGRPFVLTLDGLFTGAPGAGGPAGDGRRSAAADDPVRTPESPDGPARASPGTGRTASTCSRAPPT